jgi:hypothetical protein
MAKSPDIANLPFSRRRNRCLPGLAIGLLFSRCTLAGSGFLLRQWAESSQMDSPKVPFDISVNGAANRAATIYEQPKAGLHGRARIQGPQCLA